jgi:RNA polymerase-binding transcription factor DksA
MINNCLEFLFGCAHRNQTRPFTLNQSCYTVCLDCGHELPYSWREMRPMTRRECAHEHQAANELNTAAAA